jgi:hypothetical protein
MDAATQMTTTATTKSGDDNNDESNDAKKWCKSKNTNRTCRFGMRKFKFFYLDTDVVSSFFWQIDGGDW